MKNKTLEDLNRELTEIVLPVVTVMAMLAVLGIVGNALVLRVYTTRYPKCNFKYFVVFLALIDLLSCVVTMPLEIFTLLHWYTFYWASICKLKSFFIVFTVSSSAAALLLIAVDRFRKVWKPHGKQIKPELAVKLSLVVMGFALIPSTSDAILWGIQTFNTTETNLGANTIVSMCEKDDQFKDTIWPTLHTIVLYACTNLILMVATLVIYSLIAYKLFCTPSGSQLSPPPTIKVTTPETEKFGDIGNRDSACVFRFGSDVFVESGISDSDDIDKTPEGSRQSLGSMSNSDVPLRKKISVEGIELQQVRYSNGSMGERVKAVRLSAELLNSPNELKPPESPIRKKVSTSKSPTGAMTRRRRSTVAGSISGGGGTRLRRKTLIMFILTATFVGTSVLYFSMLSYMASSSHFVTSLTLQEATAWFFFLRLYFINSVINPILYGFLDPRFRKALWNMGVHISFFAGSLRKTLTINRGQPETVSMRRKRRSRTSMGGSSNS